MMPPPKSDRAERPPARGGWRRLRRWLVVVDLASIALAVPAIVYPYLLLYVVLIVGVLVALAAFVVCFQLPLVWVHRLCHWAQGRESGPAAHRSAFSAQSNATARRP